jgi:predicted restriction endonuclease
MATEVRKTAEGQEIAIAVQQDYLLWYVQEYERLYDTAPEAIDASVLVDARPEEEREFIDMGESQSSISRRHTLLEVVRNFREARFRPLVLRAYGYRCCLTGVARMRPTLFRFPSRPARTILEMGLRSIRYFIGHTIRGCWACCRAEVLD